MKNFMIILSIVAIVVASGCKKGEAPRKNNTRFINANGGLRMRDKPGTSGDKIALIPKGEEVKLIEETGEEKTIAGVAGKWSKVKWNDKAGWVFGGFLSIKDVKQIVKHSKKQIEGATLTAQDAGKSIDEALKSKCEVGVFYITFLKDGKIEGQNDVSSDQNDDVGVYGTWKISGNTIIVNTRLGFDNSRSTEKYEFTNNPDVIKSGNEFYKLCR